VYGAAEYSELHDTFSTHAASPIEGNQYWSRVQRQVSELLVSVAIKSRIIFDDEDRGGLSVRPNDKMLGYFVTDNDDIDPSKPFSLRDACNKILHAASVEFQHNGFDKGKHWNGIVILAGKQSGKPWRVCLYVNTFAAYLAVVLEGISSAGGQEPI